MVSMLQKAKDLGIRLLRSSERYTKTDMVYLTKGGTWLSIGQIAASLSALVLSVLFANLISQEIYGTYKYVLAIVSMLSIFTLTGINTPLAQSIARGKEGAFLSSLRAKIRWGLLGLFVSFGIGLYYVMQGNTTLAFSFFIAGCFIPAMDPLGLYNVYLNSKKLFREATLYFIISQIVASAAVALVLFASGNLYLILIAYFASWTAMRYIFHRITLVKFPMNAEDDPNVIAQGKHLSFIGALANIVTNIDSFLIFHFLGPAPVALYTLATAPTDQLKAWSKNLAPLALPKLTGRSMKEINILLYQRLLFLFFLGSLIAGLYTLAAPFLFPLIFPKYAEGVPISIAFAFTLAFYFPLYFFAAVTQSKIHLIPKSWFYWGSVPQMILILCTIFLIPRFGLWGMIGSVYLQLATSFLITAVQWKMLGSREPK
jgi:O-antigen/teichoic acid export membrane protein